ncbi:hypothetical protein [Prevotella sp.]|uniref:hypothetical protein n=1 Tax=Prevotella sp. TaxID=59823 RepID=UPI0027E4A485|nr:hypothetical protein [Prevotella sp.]
MNTVILSDGTSYYIPNSDLSFFKELALRKKWQVVDKKSRQHQLLLQASCGLMNLLVNGRISALQPK